MKRGPKPRSLEERFWRHVRIRKLDGCWLWTGHLNSPEGYGQISTVGKEQDQAHRVSYRLFVGPIPQGKKVLHTCDVHRCVNPTHVYTGTSKQNTQDMVSRGRGRWTGAGIRKLTPASQRKLVRLAGDGHPSRALAREFGVSTATVRYYRSLSVK